jgi:thiosulfate dehydrogenase (quinone) large subunit
MNSSQTMVLDRSWTLLFARLVLGLIFFMAGVYKVFQLGPLEHARKYFLPYSDTFLPIWSLWATGVLIPFIELIAGGLVILGLPTREALVSGFCVGDCHIRSSVEGATL